MKKIGIVGVTAEGASLCYRTIVSESVKILGAHCHPEISLHNIPFIQFYEAQSKKDWQTVAELLLTSIKKLASIGADFAIIPANSVHFVFEAIENASPIPLLSIVAITADECQRLRVKTVAVMGTGLTMKEKLYEKPLKKRGIKLITPKESDQAIINRVIIEEIIPGKVKKTSINRLIEVIEELKKEGSEVVILGCTELPIIIDSSNSPLPILDTTRLLAKEAVRYSLG